MICVAGKQIPLCPSASSENPQAEEGTHCGLNPFTNALRKNALNGKNCNTPSSANTVLPPLKPTDIYAKAGNKKTKNNAERCIDLPRFSMSIQFAQLLVSKAKRRNR
jgi:hypothetical protein